MHLSFHTQVSGLPFKVIRPSDGSLVSSCASRGEALRTANSLQAMTGDFYVVYEMNFCGGSRKLSDRTKEQSK